MIWKSCRIVQKKLGLGVMSRNMSSLQCTHGTCIVTEIKEYDVRAHGHNIVVKIVDGGLYFLFSLFTLFFLFLSIFRTTQVRVYQSHCHISHKLMARSQDSKEWSRRFWNKVISYNIDYICWPYVIHMVIQGRMHSSEHGP